MAHVSVHPFFASLGLAKQNFFITLLSNIAYMLLAFEFVRFMGIYGLLTASFLQGLMCICMKLIYANKYICMMENT